MQALPDHGPGRSGRQLQGLQPARLPPRRQRHDRTGGSLAGRALRRARHPERQARSEPRPDRTTDRRRRRHRGRTSTSWSSAPACRASAPATTCRPSAPGPRYAIFEARDAIGGTWDLFRYPGIRSDSDMHTLGYSFRPWDGEKSIADGDSILQYIKDTAAEAGIDQHIRFHHRVVARRLVQRRRPLARHRRAHRHRRDGRADRRLPLLAAPATTATTTATCPTSPAWTTSPAPIVHPQAWPEDLDFTGKRVVVIGSGATAVTLVPALAAVGRARHHAAALADLHRLAARAQPRRRAAPQGAARRSRPGRRPSGSHALVTQAFYQLSRRYPELVKRMLRKGLERQLPAGLRHRHPLHPALQPVGPALLRRARRRPVQGHPRRDAPRWSPTTSSASPRRASGSTSGDRARGGHHRHRHRARAALPRRHRR